jgi:hypothetical protein
VVTTASERDGLIANLQDQVEALEEIVKRRSDELRAIQRLACPKDRLMIAAILDGDVGLELQLAAIEEYYRMAWFDDDTKFLPSSVKECLDEIWHDAPNRPSGPAE